MTGGLVLTYHAVGDGPPPLFVPAALLGRHVEAIARSGLPVLTVAEVGEALRAGRLPGRFVALTFDDGLVDTVEVALPLLAAAGLRATVFAVSGRLGRANDWPSQPAGLPSLRLADRDGLLRLVAAGWEVGAHGVDHEPLDRVAPAEVVHQLEESKAALEAALGLTVRSFAYPYGALPDGGPGVVARAGYAAACTARPSLVTAAAEPLLLPRVDAHSLRSPWLLEQALAGRAGAYVALRRAGRAVRRVGRLR